MENSLYQRCLSLEDQLALVPGFQPFLDDTLHQLTAQTGQQHSDPVSLLWNCFRTGASLCHLVNCLRPGTIANVNTPETVRQNANLAKANIYYFLLACRNSLRMREDELFAINELQRDDTNGLIKVLNTVDRVFAKLQQEGKLLKPVDVPEATPSDRKLRARSIRSSMDAKTHRDKVIMELLETERKYVMDLERLQTYMRAVLDRRVLPTEDAKAIFANLDQLVDFQRKFLIFLEDICILPSDQQRLGQLFIANEAGFDVYGPFCGNHKTASELVLKHTDALRVLQDVMDPQTDLPSYLIKPVQRICKYPLLLKELIKYTDHDKDMDRVQELEMAFEATNRVTTLINEFQRKADNEKLVVQLEKAVEDWKGFNLHDFGDLILDKVLMMVRNDNEKEVHMFLFERILICCKQNKKEKKKSISFMRSSRKSSGGPTTSGSSSHHRLSNYQLKGGIGINQVEGVVASNANNSLELKIYFKDSESNEMENFILKFLSEEDLKRWQLALDRLRARYNRRSAPAPERRQRLTMSTDEGSLASRPVSTMSSGMRISTERSARLSDSVPPTPMTDHSETRQVISRRPKDMVSPREELVSPGRSYLSKTDVMSNLDDALMQLNAALQQDLNVSSAPAQQATPARPAVSQKPASVQPLPTPAMTPGTGTSPVPDPLMKIKAHHGQDIFVMFVESRITYDQLVKKVLAKVVQGGASSALTKLKYQDEDGDYITLQCDDDVAVAMKLALASGAARRVLNLYVS